MHASMSRRLLPVACIVVAVCTAPAGTDAQAGGDQCQGTFAFPPTTEPAGDESSPVTLARLDGGRLELVGVCPARRARVSRTRRGWKVAARWGRCGRYRKMRFSGRLDTQCGSFQ